MFCSPKRKILKWLLRGVQCTYGMTFQTCYVHVPKCLPVSKVKYKQNPNLNEVLMHRMTPCDACMQSGLNLISQLSWTCAWLFIITVKRAKWASSNETWFQEKSIGKVCELRHQFFTRYSVVWTMCRLDEKFSVFNVTRQTAHHVGYLWQTTLQIGLRVVVVVVACDN